LAPDPLLLVDILVTKLGSHECVIQLIAPQLATNKQPNFEVMGFHGAGDVMNAVVLTAVLSCLNSGVYTASRMLFVLAGKGEAPAALTVTSRRSVPVRAILASTFVGILAVASYISPDTVFLFLLNSSGAVILFVYLLIAASELVLRSKTPDDCLKIKMWGFPVLTAFLRSALARRLLSSWS
jgi:GABA permease